MMKIKIILLILLCVGPISGFCANARDAAIDAHVFTPKPDGSEKDGKAKVYELQGKAMLTSKGSPEERALKVGDEIRVGDAIYTEKGASISISFDNRKQNAVRIPAETKATFTSIEPTDIKLDDGSIFSVINGLAKGSTWKVTTPSAVAAVRGTVFLVRYEAANGQMYAATVDVPDDGKTSAIEIQSLDGSNSTQVVEGKEISMKEGETPTTEMVQDLSPEAVAEIQAFFEQVVAEQQAEAAPESESDQDSGETEKSTEKSSDTQDEKSSNDQKSDDQTFEEMGSTGDENLIDDGGTSETGSDLDPSQTLPDAFKEESEEETGCAKDTEGNCIL